MLIRFLEDDDDEMMEDDEDEDAEEVEEGNKEEGTEEAKRDEGQSMLLLRDAVRRHASGRAKGRGA